MEVVADDIGLVTSTDVVTYVTGSEEVSLNSDIEETTTDARASENSFQPQLKFGIFSDEHDLLTLHCHREQEVSEKSSVKSKQDAVKKKASGQSVLARKVCDKKYANGDIFTGLVDVMTGFPLQGRLQSVKSGDVYEGPFSQGRRHGNGAVLTNSNGTKFLGSFQNDVPIVGTLITPEYTYQGQLLAPHSNEATKDKQDAAEETNLYIFHGPNAMLVQKDGHVYEGDFSHGRYHGIGQERTSTGIIYRGQYRAGKWHGNGELIFEKRSHEKHHKRFHQRRNSNMAIIAEQEYDEEYYAYCTRMRSLKFNPDAFRYTYSGNWQHGEREGNGFEKIVFALSDYGSCSQNNHSGSQSSVNLEERTATFSGEFHRDRRHGHGVLTLPDGTVLVGNWKNGRPVTMADGGIDDLGENAHQSEGGRKGKPRGRLSWTMSSSRNHKHVGRKSHKKRSRPYWKIEFTNGDLYQGECTFLPHLADSFRSEEKHHGRNTMRSHLHINTSFIMCIVPHGTGTMTCQNDVYTGDFRFGKRHGYGRIKYTETGEEYDGTWIDDIPGEVGGQQICVYEPTFEHSFVEDTLCDNNIPSSQSDGDIDRNVELSKLDILKESLGKSLRELESSTQGSEELEEEHIEEAVESIVLGGSSASSSVTPKITSVRCKPKPEVTKEITCEEDEGKKNLEGVKKVVKLSKESEPIKQLRKKNRDGDNTPSTATLSHQGDDDDRSIISLVQALSQIDLPNRGRPTIIGQLGEVGTA